MADDRQEELSPEAVREAVMASFASNNGDLSGLTAGERAVHYKSLAEKLGINPMTKPFDYLRLNGKLVLYVNKGGTDQLAARHCITRTLVEGPIEVTVGGTKMILAKCQAQLPNGRLEVSVATVPMNDPLNGLMRAETKAKRRATLSILGLGMLDETEIQDIAPADKAEVPRMLEETTRDIAAQSGASASPSQKSAAPSSAISKPAPQAAESKRSITIDPSYLETLMAKARDLEILAVTAPDLSPSERLSGLGQALAELSLAEQSKNSPELAEQIHGVLASFADQRRCGKSFKDEIDARRNAAASSDSASKASTAPAASSAPATSEQSSGAPAESQAIVDLRAALRAIKPASLSSFAGVWVCLGSILAKEDQSRGQAVLREEFALALPTAKTSDLVEAIKKNKENPVEEAYARDFLAPTDDGLWVRYLDSLEDEGHVAGSFGKRAQAFRGLSPSTAKQRFDAAVERVMAITGKSAELCQTRIRDIVKHNENAQSASA